VESPEAVVIAEKSVHIGLFGTEAVAGISLRLGSLIVPGMLMIMAYRKVSKGADVGISSSDITLAVFASIFLGTLLSWPGAGAEAGMVSITHFLINCIITVSLGSVAGAFVRPGLPWYQNWIKRFYEKFYWRLFGLPAADPGYAMLSLLRHKLLDTGSREKWYPVMLLHQDGRTFYGSLSGRATDGRIILLGWLMLDAQQLDAGKARSDAKTVAQNRNISAEIIAWLKSPNPKVHRRSWVQAAWHLLIQIIGCQEIHQSHGIVPFSDTRVGVVEVAPRQDINNQIDVNDTKEPCLVFDTEDVKQFPAPVSSIPKEIAGLLGNDAQPVMLYRPI